MIGYNDGFRLTPHFVDIDFDNDDDLFIGEDNGGINFYQFPGDCCQGLRGNINISADNITDISDIVTLVDYMFNQSISILPCEQEADVTGNSYLDISDLVLMANYLFGSEALTVLCQ